MPEPIRSSLDEGFLHDLADSLGRAIADNGGGGLVYVVARPDGPDVGILPLDGLAPVDVLLGAIAPAEWAALGVATTGMADVVVLVSRDGQVVGRVRQGDRVMSEPPACRATVDCLQRALELPTPSPAEAAVGWARLRERVAAGGWPDLGLTPEQAAWLDDGSFSRWVMGRRHRWPVKPSIRHPPEP